MAYFPDDPRVLHHDSHEQSQRFQSQGEYIPLSDHMHDSLSRRRLGILFMASRMDVVLYDPDLLHDRKRRKIIT